MIAQFYSLFQSMFDSVTSNMNCHEIINDTAREDIEAEGGW